MTLAEAIQSPIASGTSVIPIKPINYGPITSKGPRDKGSRISLAEALLVSYRSICGLSIRAWVYNVIER
jgi:hypothetical protein